MPLIILVKPVSFKGLQISPSDRKIEVTYEVDRSVAVDQNTDRLKVMLCKAFDTNVCQEKILLISPGSNSIQFFADNVVGKWKFTLYHIKSNEEGWPSEAKFLDISKHGLCYYVNSRY